MKRISLVPNGKNNNSLTQCDKEFGCLIEYLHGHQSCFVMSNFDIIFFFDLIEESQRNVRIKSKENKWNNPSHRSPFWVKISFSPPKSMAKTSFEYFDSIKCLTCDITIHVEEVEPSIFIVKFALTNTYRTKVTFKCKQYCKWHCIFANLPLVIGAVSYFNWKNQWKRRFSQMIEGSWHTLMTMSSANFPLICRLR